MSIPVAVPSAIPQYLAFLGSQITYDRVLVGATVLEGVFYYSLKAGRLKENPSKADRIIKEIRDDSVSHIHEIQMLFNAIHAASILFLSAKLISAIQSKYSFSMVSTLNAITGDLPAVFRIPVLVISAGACGIGIVILKIYLRRLPPAQKKEGFEIQYAWSRQQKIAHVLHVAKCVVSLALACIAKNRPWLAIGIVGSTYSFFKNTDLKWLNFTKSVPLQLNNLPEVNGAEVTYRVLSLDPQTFSNECAICLGETNGWVVPFCTNHAYHEGCLVDLVLGNQANFLKSGTVTKRETRHYTHGIYTHSTFDYLITIPEKNLPNCPECRAYPRQNDCEIRIKRAWESSVEATVTISREKKSHAPLEALYTCYTAVQAGLAFLQQYPELAVTIFKIQEIMLITDLLGYLLTAYTLYAGIKKKYDISPEKESKLKMATAVAVVSAAALSFLLMKGINHYANPSLVPSEVASRFSIIPAGLDGTEIQWDSPLTHKIMQWLLVNRIMASFALFLISEKKKANLLSTAAQLCTLFGISQLQWLNLTQHLQWPFGKILENGGKCTSAINKYHFKELSVNALFMVSPSCRKDPAHLQSVLKSVYHYAMHLFENSRWDRFWSVTKNQYGVEVSRKLFYYVTLRNPPISACACTLAPELTNLSMSAVDGRYVNAFVQIDPASSTLPFSLWLEGYTHSNS